MKNIFDTIPTNEICTIKEFFNRHDTYNLWTINQLWDDCSDKMKAWIITRSDVIERHNIIKIAKECIHTLIKRVNENYQPEEVENMLDLEKHFNSFIDAKLDFKKYNEQLEKLYSLCPYSIKSEFTLYHLLAIPKYFIIGYNHEYICNIVYDGLIASNNINKIISKVIQ